MSHSEKIAGNTVQSATLESARIATSYAGATQLTASIPAIKVEIHDAIGSTNDRAREYLTAATDGATPLLVAADHQIAGRGRHGRSWFSPPGANALFSLALPPGFCRGARVGAMNLAAAVAVSRFVEREAGLRPGIKWPNDVEIGGAKLAGILCEAAGSEGRIGMVIGIGLNVNLTADQIPKDLTRQITSLRLAARRVFSREQAIGEIAAQLIESLTAPGETAWRGVIEAWQARCTTIGRWILVHRGQERLEGTAAALEEDGGLLLRDAEGRLHHLTAGEVTIVRME